MLFLCYSFCVHSILLCVFRPSFSYGALFTLRARLTLLHSQLLPPRHRKALKGSKSGSRQPRASYVNPGKKQKGGLPVQASHHSLMLEPRWKPSNQLFSRTPHWSGNLPCPQNFPGNRAPGKKVHRPLGNLQPRRS